MTTQRKDGSANVKNEAKEMLGLVPTWVEQMPESALAGFWSEFRDFYLGESKLSHREKELIGLGVAAAMHCRYCTLFHSEGARVAGVTDEELAEAACVAGVTMQASTFIHGMQTDYEQFKKETLEIAAYIREHLAGHEEPSSEKAEKAEQAQPPAEQAEAHA